MKKSGFTLAEILISLLILGVIASLTIPSLIQNTHKKEEVVKIKKGLSMINQAILMNYSLTGNDVTFYFDKDDPQSALVNMLKDRLSVVESGSYWLRTQDGLLYIITSPANKGDILQAQMLGEDVSDIQLYNLAISTKQGDAATIASEFDDGSDEGFSRLGHLNGYYLFSIYKDRVEPNSYYTVPILNATDPTKSE